MVKKALISIVGLFLLTHCLLLVADFILIRSITQNFSLKTLPLTISRLETVVGWQKRLSLGMSSWPYINEVYGVADAGIEVGKKAVALSNIFEPTLINSMQGMDVAVSKWDMLFDQSSLLSDKLVNFETKLNNPRVKSVAVLLKSQDGYLKLLSGVNFTKATLIKFIESKPQIMLFLGYERKTHTVVLTQNNMELWPTGGYLGSYAEFYMENGAMKDLVFQDIGVPNGQIKGYLEAPTPISKYVHNGQTPGWRLRESNWNPDFPQAMKEIEWFFVEGGVTPADYMVAINLIPIEDFVREIGSIRLLDYDLELTADNFYEITQKQTSYDFFDGSTQKRDYLNALGREILNLIMTQPQKMMPAMIEVTHKNIKNKQILMAAKDEQTAKLLNTIGWDGSLSPITTTDYLHINETNMGINKTNCCIDRKVSDVITINENSIRHQLTLAYTNNNPPKPNPPEEWGGGYKVYQRLYVPKSATLVSISDSGGDIEIDNIDIDNYGDKQIIGFLGLIPGESSGSYTVTYDIPYSTGNEYDLRLVKQSGIDSIPWEITFVKSGVSSSFDFNLTYDLTVWPQYFENQIVHGSEGGN